ncbi:MAG: prepilin-type N-terminal cleavage/methylation domain-containing protein [Desulfobacteraceae bacterium]|nr:prepilin-type N-terminal cleavage/methylation domain-containing protein [Desulfobacteraceae bacterium]
MIPKTPEKGFTLVEILIAMGASLVVLGALVSTFVIQNKAYTQQGRVIEMQENARAGLEMMTRELIMGGYIAPASVPTTDVSGESFTDNAADYIEEADAEKIAFEADVDNDGETETVRYTWSGVPGDPLRREVWEWNETNGTWGGSGGAQPLAENIQGLVLTYYDGNGTELSSTPLNSTDRANLRRITIQLTGRTRQPDPDYPANSGYRTRTLGSDVSPRNLALYAPIVTWADPDSTTTITIQWPSVRGVRVGVCRPGDSTGAFRINYLS